MTIEKMPSGKYRIKQMVNGITYRVTVDKKPDDKQAHLLIAEAMAKKGNIVSVDMPFKRACDLYIESKSNVLSPSSIRGYKGIMRHLSDIFMNTKLSTINLPIVQTEINRYSVGRSPKSVSNMSGFVMGVIKYYGINIQSPKLPQKEKKEPYIPTKEEVIAIRDAFKGTKYEIPIYLASRGLRRSEIAALQLSDLSGNVLTINKALVQDENEKWQVKTTKTTESTRQIVLDDEIADLIRKQGYIYKGYPSTINSQLHSVQKKLGIKPFSLHKFRHFCVSYLLHEGFSFKQVQAECGYASDNVMKAVYAHEMEMDKAKLEIAELFSKLK